MRAGVSLARLCPATAAPASSGRVSRLAASLLGSLLLLFAAGPGVAEAKPLHVFAAP